MKKPIFYLLLITLCYSAKAQTPCDEKTLNSTFQTLKNWYENGLPAPNKRFETQQREIAGKVLNPPKGQGYIACAGDNKYSVIYLLNQFYYVALFSNTDEACAKYRAAKKMYIDVTTKLNTKPVQDQMKSHYNRKGINDQFFEDTKKKHQICGANDSNKNAGSDGDQSPKPNPEDDKLKQVTPEGRGDVPPSKKADEKNPDALVDTVAPELKQPVIDNPTGSKTANQLTDTDKKVFSQLIGSGKEEVRIQEGTSKGREGMTLTFGDRSYEINNTEDLLMMMLRTNQLRHFDVKQIFEGDTRAKMLNIANKIRAKDIVAYLLVPYDEDGECTSANKSNCQVAYFAPAQYTIANDQNNRGRYENFIEAINVFGNFVSMLFVAKKEKRIEENYRILIYGSADSPTFTPRSLASGFDTQEYQNIIINENLGFLLKKTVQIGETYDNNELPDLRAVFIKNFLSKLDVFSDNKPLMDKLVVCKGTVENSRNSTLRNCYFVLVVPKEINN
jgi:hypothetical protein